MRADKMCAETTTAVKTKLYVNTGHSPVERVELDGLITGDVTHNTQKRWR